MKIHRAPWSGRFTTWFAAGRIAYEVQVGPLVVQWFYEPHQVARLCGGRLHLWRDRYWRI